jgi:hypothetical protein
LSAGELPQSRVRPMSKPLSVRDLPPLEQSTAPPPATATKKRMNQQAATVQHDLIIVVGFCLIGLLLTFAALAKVPDFSPAIGEISLVP